MKWWQVVMFIDVPDYGNNGVPVIEVILFFQLPQDEKYVHHQSACLDDLWTSTCKANHAVLVRCSLGVHLIFNVFSSSY